MHASTRILLILGTVVAIVAGWWVLLAINSLAVAIIYGIVWTLLVLVVTRVLLAVGFGYNRLMARRGQEAVSGTAGTATALAELSDLRERGLISPEEYDAKRAKLIERL